MEDAPSERAGPQSNVVGGGVAVWWQFHGIFRLNAKIRPYSF